MIKWLCKKITGHEYIKHTIMTSGSNRQELIFYCKHCGKSRKPLLKADDFEEAFEELKKITERGKAKARSKKKLKKIIKETYSDWREVFLKLANKEKED